MLKLAKLTIAYLPSLSVVCLSSRYIACRISCSIILVPLRTLYALRVIIPRSINSPAEILSMRAVVDLPADAERNSHDRHHCHLRWSSILLFRRTSMLRPVPKSLRFGVGADDSVDRVSFFLAMVHAPDSCMCTLLCLS